MRFTPESDLQDINLPGRRPAYGLISICSRDIRSNQSAEWFRTLSDCRFSGILSRLPGSQASCLPHPHVIPLPSSSGVLLHEPPENRPFFMNKSLTDMPPTARITSAIDISIRFNISILTYFRCYSIKGSGYITYHACI